MYLLSRLLFNAIMPMLLYSCKTTEPTFVKLRSTTIAKHDLSSLIKNKITNHFHVVAYWLLLVFSCCSLILKIMWKFGWYSCLYQRQPVHVKQIVVLSSSMIFGFYCFLRLSYSWLNHRSGSTLLHYSKRWWNNERTNQPLTKGKTNQPLQAEWLLPFIICFHMVIKLCTIRPKY